MLTRAERTRFWSKVALARAPEHRPELGECWVWAGGASSYGHFWLRGDNVMAHRVALAEKLGRPLHGQACHHCDRKLCVRPSHLFEGTQADNIADKVAKGRQARGETHYSKTRPDLLARGDRNGRRLHPGSYEHLRGEGNVRAKLTATQVATIRSAYASGGVSYSELADRFGVSKKLILNIVNRRSWRHVA